MRKFTAIPGKGVFAAEGAQAADTRQENEYEPYISKLTDELQELEASYDNIVHLELMYHDYNLPEAWVRVHHGSTAFRDVSIADIRAYNFDTVAKRIKKAADTMRASQSKSPKKYVYDICNYLGWRAGWIDPAVGGYAIKYDVPRDEVEETVNQILDAANELGIPVIKYSTKRVFVVVPRYEGSRS